uniref:GHMP kinase n=1 Tax=Caulobacter sp. (strain K31) TaxID=366602 RepID=B0T596_CAUSK
MIIVRTPLRVSFFGGGTDHPGWFRTLGPGAVLSTTIDKYVYITLRHLPPVFDFNYRVSWRIMEQAQTVDEIQHPVVRAVLKHYTNPGDCGYEIAYNADLPARSGLGSSSAFTVAALHALMRHQGKEVSKMSLAKEAIRVEQELLQEPVGSQDQTAVAFGGFNRIDFHADGGLGVRPVEISLNRQFELENRLMMFFTGFTRDAGAVEKAKVQNFVDRREQMNRLYDMVAEGEGILLDETTPIDDFGRLLHRAWQDKRSLSSGVSSGPIDRMYETALGAGALGGKILGAGGGGFMLLFAAAGRQEAIRSALANLVFEDGRSPLHVPFRLEREGSTVVLNQPQLTANYERRPIRALAPETAT